METAFRIIFYITMSIWVARDLQLIYATFIKKQPIIEFRLLRFPS